MDWICTSILKQCVDAVAPANTGIIIQNMITSKIDIGSSASEEGLLDFDDYAHLSPSLQPILPFHVTGACGF